jgi:hypothetical protein
VTPVCCRLELNLPSYIAVILGLQYLMLTISQFQICMGLQVLRERRHFTAQDLSIKAGLPSDEVSRIEAGEVGLDYLTAARLTQILGANLADIPVVAYRLDSAMVEDRYREMAARVRAAGDTGLSVWHLSD